MSIAMHAETEKSIRAYAKKRGIEAPEALDKLVGTAVNRLAALAKYANGQSAPKGKAKKTPGKKKVAKKVAKKAAKKN